MNDFGLVIEVSGVTLSHGYSYPSTQRRQTYDRQTDGRMHGRTTEGRMVGQLGGSTDEKPDGGTDGQMAGRKDRSTDIDLIEFDWCRCTVTYLYVSECVCIHHVVFAHALFKLYLICI